MDYTILDKYMFTYLKDNACVNIWNLEMCLIKLFQINLKTKFEPNFEHSKKSKLFENTIEEP